MRGLAVGLLALGVLGGTGAHAADPAGWYVGIYSGGAMRSDADMSASVTKGGFNSLSPFEHPTAVVNSEIFPTTEQALRLGDVWLANSPFAQGGMFDGTFFNGTLSFERALTTELAVGYSLGNGGRVELHYAGASFDAGIADLPSAEHLGVLGVIDAATGVWTWRDLFSLGPRPGLSGPAATVVGTSVYYTRADFVLVDGWYDFDTGTALSPYLGAGLGIARISSVSDFGESAQIVPAAEVGAGVRLGIADPVTLDMGYRYRMAAHSHLGFDQWEHSGPLPTTYSVHQSGPIGIHALTAGLTFALD